MRLDAIVAQLGGELLGDGSVEIVRVASLATAASGEISFLSTSKFREQLKTTSASAVIVPETHANDVQIPRVVSSNPYAYYARVVALLNPPPERSRSVHSSAVVESEIPSTVSVAANVVIGQRVRCGENVVFYPGCVIGDDVTIGEGSVLYPNVVIYHRCVIGMRALIHAGAVIGSDGFGFAKEGENWIKIPQIGRVVIGDDVEIGANSTIDRGALVDTQIGNGVKIDNQVHIAHNVEIGDHSALAGCVGIAGSTKLGHRCTVGGASAISGHLELANDVHISGGTIVTKTLKKPGVFTSIYPLESHEDWLHNAVQIRHLSKLAQRVSELEKTIQKITIKS